MDRTPLGLTIVEPGESPWEDGGSFFGRNMRVIDHLLRLGALTHAHDAHPPLDNPPTAPAAAPSATDGELPAAQTVYIVATAIDAEGGETLPTPMTTAVTPDALGAPAAPTGAADYTAGDLPDNSYYYVLTATDGVGGETPASDLLIVTLEDGHANGQVILDGLGTAAAAVGGTGWRLYRAVNGGPYGFLAAGATETFNDDELALRPDVQLPPPDDTTNTTGSGASIGVTVADLPADAVSYRIYASDDPTFPSPSLLGEWPAAEAAATTRVITNLILDSGQPPVVSTSVGGASLVVGGGGAGLTAVLPPFPGDIEWNPPKAEMDAASMVWRVDGQEQLAIVARQRSVEETDDPSWIGYPDPPGYTEADWRGATAEYTWDDVSPQHALVGSGALNTDNLIERVDTGPAYGDGGSWLARFTLDAGWERLYVGGVTFASVDEGFLGIIDRAAGKFQLVHVTDSSPLTYTVLAEAAIDVAAIGTTAHIYVNLIGNKLYAMPAGYPYTPLLASWLTADLTGTPLEGGSFYGAVGARWSTADTVRIYIAGAAARTLITELVADTASSGYVDNLGNPTWALSGNAQVVLWRSDGYVGGIPDAWQALGNLGYLNAWDTVAGEEPAAYVQWGNRIILRGRLANASWNVGDTIVELPLGLDPYPEGHFYVGAETTGGVLGIARVDVIPAADPDPPKLVLGAVSVADPAVALSLEGIEWVLGFFA